MKFDLYSRVAFGICAFWFSVEVLALGLGQKIILDRVNESPHIQTMFVMYAEALQEARTSIPVEAIEPEDYKRIINELRQMGFEFEHSGARFSSDESRKKWKDRLNLLVSRTRMLANPKLTDACSALPLDLESAARSHGDWRKVKMTNGSPIEPSSFHHVKLFWYFRLGCGDKRDFVVARKVLADISDLAPKNQAKGPNLQSTIRHCIAEIWARYGIGGPLSEVDAEKYSKRFSMEAWFVDGNDGPEARNRLAQRYPDASAANFKCPFERFDPPIRIDPRDPWKDLW